AVQMHLVAWRADRSDLVSMARARELCREIGDLPSVAKIAHLEFQERKDPALAGTEGTAWLDARQPDRAIKPLLIARRGLPDDAGVAAALATARGEWPDPRAMVDRLEAEAMAANDPAERARAALQAARVLRLLGDARPRAGRLLTLAFEARPRDESIYGLVEAWNVEADDRDGLIQLYQTRIRSAPSPLARIDDLRRGGTRLVLRQVQTGLGLRLLEQALTDAYRAGAKGGIPGHLAMLALLRDHAEAAGLMREFLGTVAGA